MQISQKYMFRNTYYVYFHTSLLILFFVELYSSLQTSINSSSPGKLLSSNLHKNFTGWNGVLVSRYSSKA